MALLGSSIDPRLQLQDYSGIVNAAQMQAQGLASIGQSIEAAAEQYKQYKKEQQDTQKRVKAAANLADSISALVPELKGPLGATLAQLKDPNLTLSDKDALAQSISNTLQLGIGAVAGQQDRALRKEEIDLKRGAIKAETDQALAKIVREQAIARASAQGIMANLPDQAKSYIQKNFLDQNLPDEAKAYAEKVADAVNRGRDVRTIRWQQNGVTFEGLAESSGPGQPYKPLEVNFGVPMDETGQAQDVTNGLSATPPMDTTGIATDNELPVATPPGQGTGVPGVLPEKGEIAAAQGGMPQGQVLAAAPVAQTNMSFRTIEKDGKKILVRANPNTGEMIEMTDKDGKPIAVSDEKQTKEKYFRDAMAAYDAGNTDEAIIMANAANMGGLFGSTVTINDLERTFGRPPGTKAQAEEPTPAEQTTKPTVGNPKFPLKVIRNGVPATVYDQNQLNQAIEEGFFPAE